MNPLLRAASTLLTVRQTSFLHFIQSVRGHRRELALVKGCGPCVVGNGVLLLVATMKSSSQGKISHTSVQ